MLELFLLHYIHIIFIEFIVSTKLSIQFQYNNQTLKSFSMLIKQVAHSIPNTTILNPSNKRLLASNKFSVSTSSFLSSQNTKILHFKQWTFSFIQTQWQLYWDKYEWYINEYEIMHKSHVKVRLNMHANLTLVSTYILFVIIYLLQWVGPSFGCPISTLDFKSFSFSTRAWARAHRAASIFKALYFKNFLGAKTG